jgi:hypothetical protein
MKTKSVLYGHNHPAFNDSVEPIGAPAGAARRISARLLYEAQEVLQPTILFLVGSGSTLLC